MITTILIIIYAVIALSLICMGCGISMLEYDFYGGHRNKRTFAIHCLISVVVGLTWVVWIPILGLYGLGRLFYE
jgi:hypothetical protein